MSYIFDQTKIKMKIRNKLHAPARFSNIHERNNLILLAGVKRS